MVLSAFCLLCGPASGYHLVDQIAMPLITSGEPGGSYLSQGEAARIMAAMAITDTTFLIVQIRSDGY